MPGPTRWRTPCSTPRLPRCPTARCSISCAPCVHRVPEKRFITINNTA
jgi:hypothetical protein